MTTIGLISCSKSKLEEARLNPDKKFFAKDIYTGRNFKKSIKDGLKFFNCDDYYILSGKYYLLDKMDEISYYDCYLAKQGSKYIREWSEIVYKQLCQKFEDIKDIQFIFFAGNGYCKNLVNKLNCITLKFNGQNITFDKKAEYHI